MLQKVMDRKNLKGNLIALVFILLVPGFFVTCEWRNRVRNKVECHHFLNRIRLGDTQSEVHGKFDASDYRQLTYVAGRARGTDLVTAKNQFGAKNWYIYIFYEDSRVIAVKVRTEDNIRDHPADGPPDLGKCNCPEFDEWKR